MRMCFYQYDHGRYLWCVPVDKLARLIDDIIKCERFDLSGATDAEAEKKWINFFKQYEQYQLHGSLESYSFENIEEMKT